MTQYINFIFVVWYIVTPRTHTILGRTDASMVADVGVVSVRHSLEDIYQLMLMIWCRESLALRRLDRKNGGGT